MTSTVPSESIRNRLGQFKITKELLDRIVDRTSSNAQAAWNALMMDFVVVEVEEDRRYGALRYTGYHPQFDELPDAHCWTAPEYQAEIGQTQDGLITTFEAKFRRI